MISENVIIATDEGHVFNGAELNALETRARRMGRYTGTRFLRNKGVPFAHAHRMMLGVPPRDWTIPPLSRRVSRWWERTINKLAASGDLAVMLATAMAAPVTVWLAQQPL